MTIKKYTSYTAYVIAMLMATTFISCTDDTKQTLDLSTVTTYEPEEEEEEPIDDSIIVSDEDLSTFSGNGCSEAFDNPDRNSPDVPNAANDGPIDDRSCYSNYSEVDIDGTKWGVYNITHDSNQFGGTLQPRIERALDKARNSRVGSYVKLTGTVRILETGKTNSESQDGTYFMQAKGTHGPDSNGEIQGSKEPAICLFLAKPVLDSNGNQTSFKVYREQINVRGGEGSGRSVVYLTEIKKGKPTEIEFTVGFRQDPFDSSKKIHYADAKIGNELFEFQIPEPERGLQSGIRYGAYRVKGGRAQIRWANTTYERQE